MSSKSSNLAMLSILTALSITADAKPSQYLEEKVNGKHPFVDRKTPLFVYLLSEGVVNAQNIIDLRKYLFVPLDMIPKKDAINIVNFVSGLPTYKGQSIYVCEFTLFGSLIEIKSQAINMKNASKKMLAKFDAVELLKKLENE